MARKLKSMDSQCYSAIQSINLVDDTEKRAEKYEELTGMQGGAVGKAEFKQDGMSQGFLFSRNAVQNSLVQSRHFANWCKQEYGVRMLKDITPNMASSFLQMKQDAGCSPSTLKVYKFSLMKLSSGIQERFNQGGFYDDSVKGFDTGQRQGIDRTYTNAEVRDIVQSMQSSKFANVATVQSVIGLRASEAVAIRAEHIQGDIAVITGKGGLTREIPLSSSQRAILEDIKGEQEEGRLFPTITKNGYQKAFKRACVRLGLTPSYKTHEIRKDYAERRLEELLGEGTEEREAKNEVCRELGHGPDRYDLWKIYLGS